MGNQGARGKSMTGGGFSNPMYMTKFRTNRTKGGTEGEEKIVRAPKPSSLGRAMATGRLPTELHSVWGQADLDKKRLLGEGALRKRGRSEGGDHQRSMATYQAKRMIAFEIRSVGYSGRPLVREKRQMGEGQGKVYLKCYRNAWRGAPAGILQECWPTWAPRSIECSGRKKYNEKFIKNLAKSPASKKTKEDDFITLRRECENPIGVGQ